MDLWCYVQLVTQNPTGISYSCLSTDLYELLRWFVADKIVSWNKLNKHGMVKIISLNQWVRYQTASNYEVVWFQLWEKHVVDIMSMPHMCHYYSPSFTGLYRATVLLSDPTGTSPWQRGIHGNTADNVCWVYIPHYWGHYWGNQGIIHRHPSFTGENISNAPTWLSELSTSRGWITDHVTSEGQSESPLNPSYGSHPCVRSLHLDFYGPGTASPYWLTH